MTSTGMNTTSTSPAGISAYYLLFAFFTLFLCACSYFSISSGSLLLSYSQGEKLIQGKLVQKVLVSAGKGIHKIEFSNEYSGKNYFYQRYSRPLRKPIGSSLYFYITEEGIVLRELVLSKVFFFFGASLIALVSLVYFTLAGIGICFMQSEDEIFSMSTHIKLLILRFTLTALGIGGVVYAANRMQTDFFATENKVVVNSVVCEDRTFHVKGYNQTNGLNVEGEWPSTVSQASPCIGQEVKIVFTNSGPKFARVPSGKIGTVVLLCITLMYTICITIAFFKAIGHLLRNKLGSKEIPN